MSVQYSLYKGLQKPLVFKMFKGKYIYYAGIGAVIAVAVGITVSATVSPVLGTILLIVIAAAALGFVFQKQKKGLYDKRVYKGIYLMHNVNYHPKNTGRINQNLKEKKENEAEI